MHRVHNAPAYILIIGYLYTEVYVYTTRTHCVLAVHTEQLSPELALTARDADAETRHGGQFEQLQQYLQQYVQQCIQSCIQSVFLIVLLLCSTGSSQSVHCMRCCCAATLNAVLGHSCSPVVD
jgi:hypothetical protein